MASEFAELALAGFGQWLACQPDTPARRWVEANMPSEDDVHRVYAARLVAIGVRAQARENAAAAAR